MPAPLNQKPLLKHAEQLVAAALKAGADAADAIVVQGRSQTVSCRLGEVEASDRAERNGAGLRVFVGQRQAIVSSNQPDEALVEELSSRAVEMAKASPEDEFAGLAASDELARDIADLDLFDDTDVSTELLTERALETEAAARAVKGVTNSNGASASISVSGITLVSSNGFSGSYAGTGHSLSCAVIAGDDGGMQTDYDYDSKSHLSDLRDPAEIGNEAGERTVKKINPRMAVTGTFPVIYDPRVSTSLLGHFAGAISGAAIARKTSFLHNEMGNQIFASGVSIIDDPLRVRGQGSRPFDGEGVGVSKHSLVHDGRLQSWLLDSVTARELGLKSTGHARRGVASPPSPGASNLHMEAGDRSPSDLIGAIGEGLYVTSLIGQGVNMVTGDYSRGASGYWIENGEITHPVSEITIAGNLHEMFKTLTPASDLEFRFSTNAPTLLIEAMTVGGQ